MSKTVLCESAGEVITCQLRLHVESSDGRSQLPRVRQRLIPDLDLERLGEDEPEEHDRDQAHQSELPQQAESW